MSNNPRTKGGLVLARGINESIHIVPGIEIRVNDIPRGKQQVKLWIKAPPWMNIYREEVGRVPESGICKQGSQQFINEVSRRLDTAVEDWHQVHPDDLLEAILETLHGETPSRTTTP